MPRGDGITLTNPWRDSAKSWNDRQKHRTDDGWGRDYGGKEGGKGSYSKGKTERVHSDFFMKREDSYDMRLDRRVKIGDEMEGVGCFAVAFDQANLDIMLFENQLMLIPARTHGDRIKTSERYNELQACVDIANMTNTEWRLFIDSIKASKHRLINCNRQDDLSPWDWLEQELLKAKAEKERQERYFKEKEESKVQAERDRIVRESVGNTRFVADGIEEEHRRLREIEAVKVEAERRERELQRVLEQKDHEVRKQRLEFEKTLETRKIDHDTYVRQREQEQQDILKTREEAHRKLYERERDEILQRLATEESEKRRVYEEASARISTLEQQIHASPATSSLSGSPHSNWPVGVVFQVEVNPGVKKKFRVIERQSEGEGVNALVAYKSQCIEVPEGQDQSEVGETMHLTWPELIPFLPEPNEEQSASVGSSANTCASPNREPGQKRKKVVPGAPPDDGLAPMNLSLEFAAQDLGTGYGVPM